jgi:hypothetical protein
MPMSPFVLALVLAAAPPEAIALPTNTPAAVAEAMLPDLQTGTLIFTKGDCIAVKVFTVSPYTHVAGVVMKDGKPYVYDSTSGIGTRCLTFEDWLETQRPDSIYVFQPAETFTPARTEAFLASLDAQLDRPYSVKHHLTGRRCDGLHCAEYMTDALCAARLIQAKNPPRVSPASLREGLLRGDLYAETASYELPRVEPIAVKGNSWCSQMWIDTKICTANCWSKVRRTCLCR